MLRRVARQVTYVVITRNSAMMATMVLQTDRCLEPLRAWDL
jgi:hypothetical protein